MKERIICHAEKLFYQYGIRAVRLEDIAHDLGIAKKTVYQHISSKEELIKLILESQSNTTLRVSPSEHENAITSIKTTFQIWDRLLGYRQGVNPNFRLDIKRFYPTIWRLQESLDQQYIVDHLVVNLQEGIKQGVYRSDVDVPVMAWLWARQSQLEVPSLGAEAAIKHHFIRGLLTLNGFTLYQQLFP